MQRDALVGLDSGAYTCWTVAETDGWNFPPDEELGGNERSNTSAYKKAREVQLLPDMVKIGRLTD